MDADVTHVTAEPAAVVEARDEQQAEQQGEQQAPAKRKRAAPGTGPRALAKKARAQAAAAGLLPGNTAPGGGESSGEEDERQAAASGSEAAVSRAAARRELVADLRLTCSALCRALDASQQAWGRALIDQEEAERVHQQPYSAPSKLAPKAARAAPGKPVSEPKAAKPKAPATWRAAEKEALRKTLLLFGLRRCERVSDALRAAVGGRHSRADLDAATTSFVRALLPYADVGERRLLARSLHGASTGDDARFGAWDMSDFVARNATRRMRLLSQMSEAVDALAGLAHGAEEPDAGLQAAAWAALRSCEVKSIPLPGWWSADADAALLRGVIAHGYCNYAQVRCDPANEHTFAQAVGTAKRPPARAQGRRASKEREGREGSAEEQAEEEGDAVDASVAWPSADTLTLRSKRCVDVILKATAGMRGEEADAEEEDPALEADAAAAASVPVSRGNAAQLATMFWTKKKKLDVVRAIQFRGLPTAPEHWSAMAKMVGLPTGLSMATLHQCVSDIVAEEGAACGSAPARGAATSPPPKEASGKKRYRAAVGELLAPSAARSLRDRLDAFSALAAGLALYPPPGDSLTRAGARSVIESIPDWWRPGEYDSALAQGVLKHGWGAWAAIGADASLPFAAALPARTPSKGAPPVGDGGAGDGDLGEVGGDGGETGGMPHGRALTRRLRLFIDATHRAQQREAAEADAEAGQADDDAATSVDTA